MNKTADRTVALDKGRMDVYTKNGVTLYAYQTRDLIDDEVFVLAKNGRGRRRSSCRAFLTTSAS